MDGNALVSAIIPVYNGRSFLREALESVFAQTYSPIEVIAVDDGSTDNSADIVEAFSGVRCLRQQNQGPGAARNLGILASKGSYIALLDQDDKWLPRNVELQVARLVEKPALGFTLARTKSFLEPGVAMPSWTDEGQLQRDRGFPPGAFVGRRSLFDQVGLYDPRYRYASDSDWFFRASNMGVRMEYVEGAVLLRRIHAGNQSYNSRECQMELLRLARESIRARAKGGAPK
jgi:glycosyltransferase involved in cell wall biosynthesis